MPKTSRKQAKEDERNIIRELLNNSSQSAAKIAKKCGFSRQKVWRIMKRLEKDNTLWGYTAVVGTEELGMTSYVLLVKITNLPITEKIADRIIKGSIIQEGEKIGVDVLGSYYLHGTFDWMLCFSAPDIKHAKKFVNAFNTAYQGYVAEIHLLEKIFPIMKCGFRNPNAEKLKEFTWFPPEK